MPTAEEANAINAAWNAAQAAGIPYTPPKSAAQDAADEYAKHQAAFSQPRNDLDFAHSSNYDAIVAQYNAQKYYSVGSGGLTYQPTGGPKIPTIENPQNAAQIAYNVAVSGGNLGKDVIAKSQAWGFDPTPYVNRPVQQQVATRQDIPQYDRVGNPLNSMAAQEQAMRNALNPYGRAGYTNPDTLGDINTQRMLSATERVRPALAGLGYTLPSPTAMEGTILSAQLDRAIRTEGTRDDQFFNTELQKWGQNFVERSSEYHHTAMRSGVPVPANPFEYQGDLAVEFLKGSPNPLKSSEWFSPVSGEMGANLPGDRGLQQAAWETAKTGAPGVSFADAVRYINSKEGQYGPYGKLWGGPEYQETGHNAPQFAGATPAGNLVTTPQRWLSPGPEVAVAGLPAPFRSTVREYQEPTPMERIVSGVSGVVATIPGAGIPLALAFDTTHGKNPFAGVEASVRSIISPEKSTLISPETYESHLSGYNTKLGEYNANLNRYNIALANYQRGGSSDLTQYNSLQASQLQLEQQQNALSEQQKQLEIERGNVGTPPGMLEKTGDLYESLNKALVPYTTDISGIGRILEATPDVNLAKDYGADETIPYSGIINFAKGAYVGASQHPLDIVAGYGGGKALALGEYGIRYGIARAAMSEAPVISTIGRAASTPLAGDITMLGKTLVGAYIVGAATGEVLSKPTAESKGESFGRTAMQFTGFGTGYSSLKLSEPMNEYAGRGFFSGQQQMGPVERAIYETRVELLARSQPTPEQATLIRTAGQLGGSSARFNEAPVKGEPVFEEAKALGQEYGPLIRGVAADVSNPTITKGSMVVASQYPKSTVVEAGLREAKDWDALVYDVGAKFETIAAESRRGFNVPESKQFASAQEVMASGIADLRPIPQNYPGFKPSVAPDVRPEDKVAIPLMERIIGNPFEKIVGPRGTSEQLLTGRTKGYTGKTSAESAQAQFGRKVGSALKDFAQDPIGQGYRGQKDIYDVITEFRAQKITAREAGVDVTKGEWAENEAAIERMLDLNIRIGSEKGQTTGGRVVNLREWFAAKEAEVRSGKMPSEELPFIVESPSARGVVSPAASSMIFASGGAASRISPPSEISQKTRMSPSKSTGSRSTSPSVTESIIASMISPSVASPVSPSIISPSVGSPSPSGSLVSPSSLISPPSPSPSLIVPESPYVSPSPSYTPTPYIPPSPVYSPTPWVPSPPSAPPTIFIPPPSEPSIPPSVPPTSYGWLPGSGGGSGGRRPRRRRKVELFSFEEGITTPIPARYGLGGKTTMFVPGYRGIARDILRPSEYAPNPLSDILGTYRGNRL